MIVEISRGETYGSGEQPGHETYDLTITSEGGESPAHIADIYLLLREKLNKAIEEGSK